jgi:hypothetical protein
MAGRKLKVNVGMVKESCVLILSLRQVIQAQSWTTSDSHFPSTGDLEEAANLKELPPIICRFLKHVLAAVPSGTYDPHLPRGCCTQALQLIRGKAL